MRENSTTPQSGPSKNGVYWLLRPGLRRDITVVRDGKYAVPAVEGWHDIAGIKEDHEWIGPVVFRR